MSCFAFGWRRVQSTPFMLALIGSVVSSPLAVAADLALGVNKRPEITTPGIPSSRARDRKIAPAAAPIPRMQNQFLKRPSGASEITVPGTPGADPAPAK